MTREQAIKKVLRCLALAGSSNPNEAATAMRQARKLMEEYGITEADARTSEYSEARSKTRARGAMLTPSLSLLASVIADGFRCELIVSRKVAHYGCMRRGSTHVAFVGRGADPTIAAYAFDVLRRKLDSDRLAHISRCRKRANREARGEEFALGWVNAVRQLFPAADLSDEDKAALSHAMQVRYPSAGTIAPREVGKGGRTREDDFSAGWIKGKDAQLHAGVDGAKQAALTHG